MHHIHSLLSIAIGNIEEEIRILDLRFKIGRHLTENYNLESGTIICKVNYNL